MTHFSDYKLEVRPLSDEDGGGFVATIPELAGCTGDGKTPEEAISDLRGAFDAWIATAKEMGRDIPRPGGEAKPLAALIRWPRSLHLDLTRAAEEEGTSFNLLVVSICASAIGSRANGRSLFAAAAGTSWSKRASGTLAADVPSPFSDKGLSLHGRTGAMTRAATTGVMISEAYAGEFSLVAAKSKNVGSGR